MKIEFDQVVALVIIVIATVMMVLGIDHEMKSILTLAAGWAFGSGYQARRVGVSGRRPPAGEPPG